MKVLITGANGYVGARLMEDLSNYYETYGTYHTKNLDKLLRLDVANKEEVISIVNRIRPEMIVHASAIPNQNKADQDVELAKRVNVVGTTNVAEAANGVGASVVFISSNVALAPERYGTYGITKFEAEKVIEKMCKDYLILRPGLIIGQSPNTENDRFQNRLLNNIVKKTPAIYDNVEKYEVTWAGQLCEVIVEAKKRNITSETIPIVVDEYKTRFEIARDILQNFNVDVTQKEEQKPVESGWATTRTLKELNLKVYGYTEVIEKTVEEIKDYLKNKFQDRSLTRY
ncbi:MAG: sugar nucleotide-binding protein [Candidatus Micrarchaeales archaeon]|nr:sugar nucleotide-binding protein [Candidatus Micrarchaeales archaeon]